MIDLKTAKALGLTIPQSLLRRADAVSSETERIRLGLHPRRTNSMMTIVTHAQLKEGAGGEWDTAMRTRLSAAKKRPGWVGGQLLRPSDKPDRREIVGTWRTRADWETWHQDPQFAATRRRLEGLESGPAEHWWHEVVLDVRKSAASPPSASKQETNRASKAKTKKPRRR